jgi:hypothetical protein
MSTHTTVEVFLGHSVTVASENPFLARLRRDLLKRGVFARILANLQVGKDVRQVDFVVITEHRVVQEPAARIVRLGASDQPITPRSRSSARLSGLPLAATGTPGTAVIV